MVRLYLASALQRIDKAQRWPLATELMSRDEDASDENIPKLVWLAIEPLVKDQPAFALERASQSNVPLISRFIARRAVDADAVEPVVAALSKSPKAQTSLLEGLRDGVEGRLDLSAPNWNAVYGQLRRADAPAALASRSPSSSAIRSSRASIWRLSGGPLLRRSGARHCWHFRAAAHAADTGASGRAGRSGAAVTPSARSQPTTMIGSVGS